MNPLQIVIVDDHPLFRMGLKNILTATPELEVIAVVDQFENLKKVCIQSDVDVVLMDLELENDCGAYLTSEVKRLFPFIRVLALTSHGSSECIYKMLEAGVSGYVLKDAEIEELSDAIKIVAKGKTYFSNSVSQLLIQPWKKPAYKKNISEKLTLREQEILKFIIQDELTNKEIAHRLFISPRTVETHKRNLILKLQVKNIIGLAKYYFQNKMLFNENYGIPLV